MHPNIMILNFKKQINFDKKTFAINFSKDYMIENKKILVILFLVLLKFMLVKNV
tara:strand:+ start:116 stop:277 length:162 start_codon:yes stop_codon:yes gene_type:complete